VTADLSLDRVPTAVSLFRYSAVTWNAHRVHYDLAYATTVEGHRGLLVQAYLLSSYLSEMLMGWGGPSGRVTALSYRARQPVYVGTLVHCWGRQTDVRGGAGFREVDLQVGITADGRDAVTGTACMRLTDDFDF
jgi:hydroxyacyl-ACP dehydratase HTD2-like protein with hotdog domain